MKILLPVTNFIDLFVWTSDFLLKSGCALCITLGSVEICGCIFKFCLYPISNQDLTDSFFNRLDFEKLNEVIIDLSFCVDFVLYFFI